MQKHHCALMGRSGGRLRCRSASNGALSKISVGLKASRVRVTVMSESTRTFMRTSFQLVDCSAIFAARRSGASAMGSTTGAAALQPDND